MTEPGNIGYIYTFYNENKNILYRFNRMIPDVRKKNMVIFIVITTY